MKAATEGSGGYLMPPVRRRRGFGGTLLNTLRKPQFQFGAVTLVPVLIWYSVFVFWSVIQSFRMAVIHYRIVDPDHSRFVGLDNFRYLFDDPLFPVALKNSLAWGLMSIVITIPVALGVSLCLVNVKRGRTLYQTLIFIPVVLSLISVVLLLKILFDPQIGPINSILSTFHLPTSQWLDSSDTALPTAVGIGVWKGIGVTIVILTAGLLNIPTEVNDAARVDGAGPFGRFWHITLPLLQPTLNLILILGVINGLQEFTLPQTLTQGGPDNATYLLNLYIYNTAFQTLQFSQAAAAALVEFAITLALTLLTLRLTRVNWSY
jgi:ABC-type sugar transport system permease subunit